MIDYQILPSQWDTLHDLLKMFVGTLHGPTDSYWEEKLLKAQVYAIESGHHVMGFFSVYQQEILTSFYLLPEYVADAERIFQDAKRQAFVQSALVATCDELFLSLSLDGAKDVQRQAYFFQSCRQKEPQRDIDLKFAAAADEDLIRANSEDFFDDLTGQIRKGEILLARHKKSLVGFGVMERGNLRKSYVSIGMYVCKEERLKGYGASILQELKARAQLEGLMPIAGCWVWNHGSKKTLEHAGMHASTRYLKIGF